MFMFGSSFGIFAAGILDSQILICAIVGAVAGFIISLVKAKKAAKKKEEEAGKGDSERR